MGRTCTWWSKQHRLELVPSDSAKTSFGRNGTILLTTLKQKTERELWLTRWVPVGQGWNSLHWKQVRTTKNNFWLPRILCENYFVHSVQNIYSLSIPVETWRELISVWPEKRNLASFFRIFEPARLLEEAGKARRPDLTKDREHMVQSEWSRNRGAQDSAVVRA